MKRIMQRIIAGVLVCSIVLNMIPLTTFAQKRVLYGDVNRSGLVDQSDVNDMKKYLAEYDIDIDKAVADVNRDSSVDLKDLLLIEKYVAGLNVVLGDNVMITFDTDGGTAVDKIMLCNGAAITDVTEEPVTDKEGYVFTGWVKEDGTPFYAQAPVTTNLNLRAKFEVLDNSVDETPQSFALDDQAPNLSYNIVTTDDLTADEVLAKISLLATDGSEPVEIKVVKVSSKLFTISAENGFNPGCTYELTLSDGLYFKDKAETLRKATCIIHKNEVDNLKYNDDIKYIKDTEEMSYTLDNSATTVPVLDITLISNGKKDTVSGSFDYKDGGLAKGDTLCIYEKVDPRNRDYTKNEDQDDSVSFVKVTGVNGITIHFKGIDESQATDVIFMPDTIPFSVANLPSLDNDSIASVDYDSIAWSFMGHSDDPKFDVGDFVVMYNGKFKDMTDTSPVYYGEITAINGTTISIKKTTADAIESANDVFLSNPMSGDELLKNVDAERVESQIKDQAINSGFAKEAVDHLITMATKTDNFKNMSLEDVTYTDGKGNALSQEQAKALASSASVPKIVVTAKISKDCTNFDQGVRLELGIDAEFSISLDDGDMKFSLHATFVEEIYVKVSLNSHAHVKWYVFIPVLDELTFGANTDIKNYTSIAVDLRIYTVQGDKGALWDQFKNFQTKYKDTLQQIKELEQKLDEASETKDKLNAYKQTIKNLWLTMPAGSEATYDSYCDQLGEVNMSSKLNKLLKSTSDEETDAGVQDLMNRYSKMMKTETSWVTLVEKNIFEAKYKFAGGLVSVGFSLDFVIKTNVNISIGISMNYLVGKRYSFWIDIINKTSGSSITDLTDEKFAFKFYVMGYIGLKMGIKATVSMEVLWGLAGVGISGEFGPYIKLWGYFIYQYTKMRPANTPEWNIDTQMAGALYLEFGIYVTISFNVDVVKKTVYNPDLYDKEFPLLTAGVRNNVYAYGYKMDKDEAVVVKDNDNDSNTGINMLLPNSYGLMQYMDLVEGNIEKSVYDFSNFAVTLSNSNFSFDNKTGNISVTVPDNVQYMKCNLTLTWKQSKLAFSTRDLRIVIPLVWTSLSDSELKQKYTVTVNVGNATDGYVPLWSERIMKNEYFNLPTQDEMLDLLNYDDYNFNGSNLKYANIKGYGSQKTTNLQTYADANYYFNVDLKEYDIIVKNVQNTNGTTRTANIKTKIGERFDLSSLQNSGSDDDNNSNYTSYYNTIAKDQSGNVITSDIGRTVDVGFAKELLSGITYTATYVDNSITATYKFEGDVSDIPDKTVKIKRGSAPPDLFTEEVASRKAIVTSITPKLGNIFSDTTYKIVSKNKPIVMRTITYQTNEGSSIEAAQFPEESIIAPPNDPTRSGYTFKGWYSDASFQNSFVFDIMPTHDVTLYAKWEGDSFQITFNANGGTLPDGTTNQVTVKNGTTYGTLPTPTFPQHRFDGWYTAHTGGIPLTQGSDVFATEDTTVFARWVAKTNIDPSTVICSSGQSATYNQKFQPVTFSTINDIPTSSFTVMYMRQGVDSEWASEAVNAGTYNVKITRQEDNNYNYFEKIFSGVYIINKAASSILKAPSSSGVYYGSIAPKKAIFGTDYIGGDQLEYAVSNAKTQEPTSGWSNSGVVYNVYDSSQTNITGNSVYLWVRNPESENYLASSSMVSTQAIDIITKPKALVSDNIGGKQMTYKLWVQTSDISNAGTNSRIYAKIGNGAYQQLDSSADDFERGDLRGYDLAIDPNILYNNCGGTIPILLRYERAGSASGWHCEWVRLDVYVNGVLKIQGNQYSVNSWFGAEENDYDVVERPCNLTGYERGVNFEGAISQSHDSTFDLQSTSDDFSWDWSQPSITDTYHGVTYNPYEYINAPELLVSFNNAKYNKYITKGVKSFALSSKELYQAMVDDGTSTLDLTATLEFKPLNGISSVSAATTKRTQVIQVTCSGVKSKALSLNNVPAKQLATQFGGSFDNITSTSIEPGKNGTFDVSYSLDQNSGIWGAKFAVNYDKTKITMTGYTLGNIFTAKEVTAPVGYDNGRYVFLASRNGFTDTVVTGKLVTLHFKMKDGANLTDYPVTLDTTVSQYINGESGIVRPSVNTNAPKISVSGNTSTLLRQDTITVSAFAGNSAVQSVRVRKGFANFTDITSTYSKGYSVSENGTYTFELTTTEGDTATTSIIYTQLDNKAPSGKIIIGQNRWNTVLNNITFGLFFHNTKAITIESTDTGSGIANTEYYLSNVEVSDVSSIKGWTKYTKAVTLEPNHKYIVYARITDKAGNVTIINSDGVVLFTNSTASQTSLAFKKTSMEDVTATVNLNGNTIKEIRIGKNVLIKNTDYIVSGGIITLKASYLTTLAAGNYTVVVSYYPLGETGIPKQGSDTPASTSIALTVSKALSSLSFREIPVKTYGNAPFTVTATGGGTGAVTYSVVSGPAIISGNTVTLTGAGAVVLRANKAADNNYNAKSVQTTITVNKKKVTITGITAQNKVYDGGRAASVSGTAIVRGKESGDTVSVLGGTATFANKMVGNNKTVTFMGFTLSGKDADKYTLAAQPKTMTANITAKPVTTTITIQDKAFDGLNTAVITSAALNGVISGDKVSLFTPYPTATFASVNAASNIAVNFSGNFELTGADKGNYVLTQPNAAGNITNSNNQPAPKIIQGENGQWKQGERGYLTFRSDAEFKDFLAVLVDGKVIDAKNYDLKEGSIIVMLKADYLATLPAGAHTISIQSVTGTASAKFTIVAKTDNTKSPQSSDKSKMFLWIALLFVSGSIITVFGVIFRKRKAVKEKQ